jgi:hypothetical protein
LYGEPGVDGSAHELALRIQLGERALAVRESQLERSGIDDRASCIGGVERNVACAFAARGNSPDTAIVIWPDVLDPLKGSRAPVARYEAIGPRATGGQGRLVRFSSAKAGADAEHAAHCH